VGTHADGVAFIFRQEIRRDYANSSFEIGINQVSDRGGTSMHPQRSSQVNFHFGAFFFSACKTNPHLYQATLLKRKALFLKISKSFLSISLREASYLFLVQQHM